MAYKSDDCFYRILGFTGRDSFDTNKTKAFYRYLQLLLHPDKLEDASKIKRAADVCKLMNKGKNVLLTPQTKANYDWMRSCDFNGTIMHHDCGEFRDAINWMFEFLKGKTTPSGMKYVKVNQDGYETEDSDDSLNFQWNRPQNTRRQETPPYDDTSSDDDYVPHMLKLLTRYQSCLSTQNKSLYFVRIPPLLRNDSALCVSRNSDHAM